MQKNKIISGEQILDYIPQRPPIVMVNAFYGVEGEYSYSSYTISEADIFCHDGFLDECALIENIAQSAALRVGWLCVTAGQKVPLGFIGSVGKCEITRKPVTGETLYTTLKIVAEVGNITLAEADITSSGENICTCTLKIFLQQ